MVFQFYSHSHLYEDTAAGTHSRKYSRKAPKRKKANEKEPVSPVPQPDTPTGESGALTPPQRPHSPSSFPRSLSSAPDLSSPHSLGELPPQNTLRLVIPSPSPRGSPTLGVPMDRTETTTSDRSDVTLTEGQDQQNPLGREVTPETTDDKAADIPQLSWVMTVSILAVVSVVRI